MTIKVTAMDEVQPWSGTSILGAGNHPVSIGSAVEGTSRNGHDQVELEFDALDSTGSIRDWLVFTEGTLGKARMLLDAVGIQAQSGDWEFPTAQLVGRRLTITVAEEPDYNDPAKTRMRVKAYLPAAEQPSDIPTPPAEPAATPVADDSGIPF